MQWQEINKETLENLKHDKLVFWTYVKDVSPYIHDLYKICLVTRVNNHPSLGNYWFVLSVKNTGEQIRDSISDDDIIDFFSHYCIVNQPERSKREDNLIHCDSCECDCNCGDSFRPHNHICKVSQRRS